MIENKSNVYQRLIRHMEINKTSGCWECKYHEDTSIAEYEHCCLIGKTVRHDDFCSYGEQKEGAD